MISSSINENERGKAIGTWSAVTTVVTMGGPILGGALADAGLWRFIFFINVPIGIAALFILWRHVNEIKDGDSGLKLDFPGAITIALGLAMITFGFLRIPAIGFNNWEIYCSFAAGFLLLASFIFIEIKSKYPMMPLHLFKNLTFSGANLLTLFLYAGLGAGMLFLSLNLVQVQGYSQFQSGLTFLPFTLLMITIARFAGGLADKYGPRLFLIAGPAVAGAGLLLLSVVKQTPGPSSYFTTFFPGIIVFGLGMSFTVAPLTAAVMAAVSDHFSGTASGVNNAISRIANVFAYAIFGALAVLFFAGALSNQVKNLPVSNNEKRAIMAQAANLGNAKVPSNVNAENKAVIEKFYHEGFIAAYSKILKISGGLGFLGALMAFALIRHKPLKKENIR
ncbi:MAG TPA: MFS transporter [Mucilaginibacter sp.]